MHGRDIYAVIYNNTHPQQFVLEHVFNEINEALPNARTSAKIILHGV